MRTTVTLDPDVQELVGNAMRERRASFKQVINDAIRIALAPEKRKPFKQRTFNMGLNPDFNYVKALQIAGELEDQELLRQLSRGE